MILLLSGLWPGLFSALGLGLAVGWASGPPRGPAIPAALGLAMLALAGLALGGIVSGPPGLWLESATLMLAAYVAGCGFGALGRALSAPRARAISKP